MSETPDSSRRLWLVLFAVTMVQALATFASLTIAAIAPAVADGVGVPVEFIGFQVAVIYTGASSISSLSDFLLRRWGPARVSQISLALCGGGVALSAVPLVPVMALGALFLGFGYGMTNPSSTQILMRLTPNHARNFVFSVKQTGVPFGGMAAGLVAPGATEAFGWQAAPLIVAVCCVIAIFALQPWRNRWDADRNSGARLDASAFAAMSMVWRVPALRWLSIGGFTYAFTQLSLSTFAVTILVVEAQFSLVAAGAVLAAIQAAGIIGRVAWGLIADRWGIGDNLLVIMGVMNLTGAFAMIWIGPDWPVWAIYFFFVAFAASALGWTGVFISSTVGHAPRAQSGAVAGGIGVPVYAGVIFGAAILSALADTMGSVSNTYAVVMGVVSVGLIAFVMARRHTS
ncbi:MAG: MFS transporter [Rhodospirillaceae bacterium]|jgi:predicted MFS family arabinose efflux permease|nr:MFS transporter [Rhodospirillaceae bacterium]MBT3930406.1 MFS transporter [Rhodospirillaceae bacterium]MBT4772364.1 MFS transporter [Rhodospirillaceae bacterium]MBT5359658.1 MFS transporter [Rhodospirillaceae bacterium]MBT5769886.1 MFS transporter [Rhodospirillaceae bacterium]